MANPVIIEDSISIAANTVVANVIEQNSSLKRYSRAPFPAKGTLIAVESATGLYLDMDVGASNVAANCLARVASDFNFPDDVINDQYYAEEGSMLVLKASNNTGSAITLKYRIVLDPMGEPGERVDLPPDTLVMQEGPIAVANNTVDQQLLSGKRYQRPPRDCIMDTYMTASAAGITRQTYVDVQNIAPPSAVKPTNRVPLIPFDLSVQGIEVPRDKQIDIAVSNSSGGSLNVFWKVALHQLSRN